MASGFYTEPVSTGGEVGGPHAAAVKLRGTNARVDGAGARQV